jgi:spermidine/putrescine transport system permease protein
MASCVTHPRPRAGSCPQRPRGRNSYHSTRRAYESTRARGADLGANEWKTFWTVTLPNIRTAILGAALLVFTLSMDEIAVTYFLIGRQNTIPMEIFGRMRRIVDPEINAVSAIIFVASIVVIIVWARLMREE